MTTRPPEQALDAVILLAGGQGRRMGESTDKILQPIHGTPLFRYALDSFAAFPALHWIIIVHRDNSQKAAIEANLPAALANQPDRLRWATGGETRRDSVARGLQAVPREARLVFIHDLARPLVHPENLKELTRLALRDGAAGLAHRVTDTIKQVATPVKKPEHLHPADLERDRLWATETPQVFQRDLIQHAYRQLLEKNHAVTDDLAAGTALGHPISLLENPNPNPKLTTPRDLPYLSFLLKPQS